MYAAGRSLPTTSQVYGTEKESIEQVELGQRHVSLLGERNDSSIDQIVLDTYMTPDTIACGDIRFGAKWRSVVSYLN
jgi:hypothetical protein